MIESLKSASALNLNLHVNEAKEAGSTKDEAGPLRQHDPAGEAATLSAAIQRLIAERDSHKSRFGSQEQELTRLRAVNEELRRQHEQTLLLADHYMRLATEVLTTLRNIDSTIHDVVQRSVAPATPSDESRDAALMSLVRRLSPRNADNDQSEPRQ
ncbi:MAG: hypothetical protein WBD84_12655 [Methyloceanibacter sp.]